MDAETSNGGWGVDGCGTCDNASNNWEYNIGTATSSGGYLFYDPDLQNSRKHLYTPWIWVPVSVTSLNGFIHHETIGIMEALYDGVSLEYSVNNGSTWTQVPAASFTQATYNGTADGYNQACTGGNVPDLNAWNSAAQRNSEFTLTVTGAQWIRFRFVGTADAAVDDNGYFRLYSFALSCVTPAFGGGAFAAGNIYAENNVYAGSNVLQGDVAEYFNVEDSSNPGDLICMSSEKGDAYSISEMAYNPFVIGIHSTNPTVTLNTPVGTPVSLTGRVPVNVSAENGAIKIGDYLTASAIKGYAMKADKPCYIIGRALEKFDSKEKGKIICLVETGWYNPGIGGSHSGGSFYVKEGQSGVNVNDPSVKKESRIFLTFKNKTGAEYWVSEINDGAFTISFDKIIPVNISFDYFVDNANMNNTAGYKKKEDAKELQTVSAGNKEKIQGKELPEYHNEAPPSPPSDVTKGWVWSPQTGFKLSDHFINSKE